LEEYAGATLHQNPGGARRDEPGSLLPRWRKDPHATLGTEGLGCALKKSCIKSGGLVEACLCRGRRVRANQLSPSSHGQRSSRDQSARMIYADPVGQQSPQMEVRSPVQPRGALQSTRCEPSLLTLGDFLYSWDQQQPGTVTSPRSRTTLTMCAMASPTMRIKPSVTIVRDPQQQPTGRASVPHWARVGGDRRPSEAGLRSRRERSPRQRKER
jgi:hypothetical protein